MQTNKIKLYRCKRCGRTHEGSPTFCGGCGNDQFEFYTPRSVCDTERDRRRGLNPLREEECTA